MAEREPEWPYLVSMLASSAVFIGAIKLGVRSWGLKPDAGARREPANLRKLQRLLAENQRLIDEWKARS